jgi:hypothetical protein
MSFDGVQHSLFKQVKERLPAHLSLADEVASLLGISADSAYRRIRGEKKLDLEELLRISTHFRLSVDQLLGRHGDSFVFNGRIVGSPDLPFADWLVAMNDQLDLIAGMKDPLFIFRAEDIPTFHYFQIPELTLFKLFFWRRTLLNDPEFQNRKFDLQDREEPLLAMARKVYLTYLRLPCTEIWNADSLNAFLRQITFYRDSGIFLNDGQVQVLFEKLHELIDHLQAQVEAGVKFLHGGPSSTGGASFKVYVNEVMQGDNMVFAGGGGQRIVFVNHSAINYVSTTDVDFCDHTQRSIENVIRRSVLISGTGEKERHRYFKALREEVERRRQ